MTPSLPFGASLRRFTAACAFAALALAAVASDHADPMSLNVFKLQDAPEANITDLHAFLADSSGHVLPADHAPTPDDCLIVSLCVRRAITPKDEADLKDLDVSGFSFRVHLDLDPVVRFHDPYRTINRKEYVAEVARLKLAAEQAGWKPESSEYQQLNNTISRHETEATLQALYGGIILNPTGIAEEVTLEFKLILDKTGPEAVLESVRVEGVPGPINAMTRTGAWQKDAVNVQAGIFDDPFIFPRFFRRNVVGIVTSIPLGKLRRPDGSPSLQTPGWVTSNDPDAAPSAPMLLWATTHCGAQQIDHVGRSLRTQLPRFGYLNELHPAGHVAAITRVHHQPTLMENTLATFLAPLIAHRHYDSVPDVMVYDLLRPVGFPNGRRLEDDVAQHLADAGEGLLYELAYSESRQFPRATTNDKPFRPDFPFLATRWNAAEVMATAGAGSVLPGADPKFEVPRAPDRDAIAPPNLGYAVWRSLWKAELILLGIVTLLFLVTTRSNAVRLFVLLFAALAVYLIDPLRRPSAVPPVSGEAYHKLNATLFGGGIIVVLGVGWIYTLGRRHGARSRRDPRDARQGLIDEDRDTKPLSYDDVRRALFANPYSKLPWGSREATPFPRYELTFARLTRGLLQSFTHYPFLDAARRTLLSHADLRWGPDRRGFTRLLHPNGMILTGEWEIDAAPEGVVYTGYFATGKRGPVIARYSTCCTETRSGRLRSLALVAKIYPDIATNIAVRPASLITQEDLGGTKTDSIREAELTNSPPVTPSARGSGLFAFLVTGLTLRRANPEPTERQLYEIAELEKPAAQPTCCPRFLRLTLDADESTPSGQELDFRDEVLATIYDRGDPVPKRALVFNIEVSDTGKRHGLLNQRLTDQQWTRIGRLTLREAVVSYNGDFVAHFHHPLWRTDRNDPATSVAGRDA